MDYIRGKTQVLVDGLYDEGWTPANRPKIQQRLKEDPAKREAEIVLGRFKVGWAGERMTFAQLSEEFLHRIVQLFRKSQENHQIS